MLAHDAGAHTVVHHDAVGIVVDFGIGIIGASVVAIDHKLEALEGIVARNGHGGDVALHGVVGSLHRLALDHIVEAVAAGALVHNLAPRCGCETSSDGSRLDHTVDHTIQVIYLVDFLAGQLVDARGPVERHLVLVVGLGTFLVGLGKQLDGVEEGPGSVVGVVETVLGIISIGRFVHVAIVGVIYNTAKFIGFSPPQQAIVGDKEVESRHVVARGTLPAAHREEVGNLQNRVAVVHHGIGLTLHHLVVEVGEILSLVARKSIGGTELLKHVEERRHHLAGKLLFSGLALAQEEKAVERALHREERAGILVAAHPHAIGKELHEIDRLAYVLHQVSVIGNLGDIARIIQVGVETVFHGHEQHCVALLVGLGGRDVPAIGRDRAVVYLVTTTLVVGVVVKSTLPRAIGAVVGTRDTGVAVHLLEQGDDLVGVGSLVGELAGDGVAAIVGPRVGDCVVISLAFHDRLSTHRRLEKDHAQERTQQ